MLTFKYVKVTKEGSLTWKRRSRSPIKNCIYVKFGFNKNITFKWVRSQTPKSTTVFKKYCMVISIIKQKILLYLNKKETIFF